MNMEFLEKGIYAPSAGITAAPEGAIKIGELRTNQHQKMKCEQVLRVVTSYFGVSLVDLLSSSRNKQKIAFARQIAMYLANTHYAVSMSYIGKFFGRDRTTVSFGCRKIEDCRDNERLDTIISCLELMLANSDSQAGIGFSPAENSTEQKSLFNAMHG